MLKCCIGKEFEDALFGDIDELKSKHREGTAFQKKLNKLTEHFQDKKNAIVKLETLKKNFENQDRRLRK